MVHGGISGGGRGGGGQFFIGLEFAREWDEEEQHKGKEGSLNFAEGTKMSNLDLL